MTEQTIHWQPSILEDHLVQVVALAKSDFEELYEAASDPLIWEQHPNPNRYKREVFQTYFDGGIEGKMAFKIIDKTTGGVIGSTRFYDYNPEDKSIAIGYTFLVKAYWGGTYNHAVKRLLLDYAFQFVDKVYFHIAAANIRSQRAIANIGSVKVAELDTDPSGKPASYVEYLIAKPV